MSRSQRIRRELDDAMNEPAAFQRSLSTLEWPQRMQGVTGFGVLGIMVTVLYGLCAQQAWVFHPACGVAVSVLLAMVLLALVRETRTVSEVQPHALLAKRGLVDFASVVGGGLATYVVSVDLGLGAVAASGLVGLLGAVILPQWAAAIYCGSFVGMVSPALLDCYSGVLLAGVVGGGVYFLSAEALQGFGGKLGTIALTGTVLAGLGLGCEFIPAEVPSGPVAWHVLLCATVAAVVTYWLSVDLGRGPVMASSIVGLLGGLVLPALVPEGGPLLAVVVICASFTGMSSRQRIPHHLWMTLAGMATGLVFIYSLPVLGGAGGKLGTIAFGASMGTWAFRTLLGRIELQPAGLSDHSFTRRRID